MALKDADWGAGLSTLAKYLDFIAGINREDAKDKANKDYEDKIFNRNRTANNEDESARYTRNQKDEDTRYHRNQKQDRANKDYDYYINQKATPIVNFLQSKEAGLNAPAGMTIGGKQVGKVASSYMPDIKDVPITLDSYLSGDIINTPRPDPDADLKRRKIESEINRNNRENKSGASKERVDRLIQTKKALNSRINNAQNQLQLGKVSSAERAKIQKDLEDLMGFYNQVDAELATELGLIPQPKKKDQNAETLGALGDFINQYGGQPAAAKPTPKPATKAAPAPVKPRGNFKVMIDENGNRARVYEDGSFEEF